MDTTKTQMALLNIVRGWTQTDVMNFLVTNDLKEYMCFADNKCLDGYKLLSLSEGLIAMWRPKVDAKKLISVIKDLQKDPLKYLQMNGTLEYEQLANSNPKNLPPRCKPKVPMRIDSLIKRDQNQESIVINLNSTVNADCKSKNIASECEESYTVKKEIKKTSEIDLDSIIAPKSFLYSSKMRLAITKIHPYAPMENTVLDPPRSQDDAIIFRKRRYLNRMEEPFFDNKDNFDENTIIQDRGYYEMSSRRSGMKVRRFSDGDINNSEENTYEELMFKTQKMDATVIREKKKPGILKRVLRKQNLKKEKNSNKDESPKQNESKSSIGKINEKVVKKLSPILSSNYKFNDVANGNDSNEHSPVKSVKYQKYSEIFEESCKDVNEIEQISNAACIQTVNDVVIAPPIEFDVCEAFYEDPEINIKTACKRIETNVAKPKGINNYDVFYEEPGEDSKTVFNDHLYEVADPFINCYDKEELKGFERTGGTIEVEEYLEPIQHFDRTPEAVMDNLAEEMMRLFDASMQTRDILLTDPQELPSQTTNYNKRQENTSKDRNHSNESTMNKPKPPISKKPETLPVSTQPTPNPRIKQKPTPNPRTKQKKLLTPPEEAAKPKPIIKKNSCDEVMDDAESANSDRPFETLQKWNETLTNSVKMKKEAVRVSMEGRPLPVPVENEFYYMEVGRKEAEDLLEGHADGTFILRPSSQPTHAYTVTLTYMGRIYNIGCRRRDDGRLALGFSKTNEQSFLTVNHLIEHYYTEKLVLLVDGKKVGSTALRKLNV